MSVEAPKHVADLVERAERERQAREDTIARLAAEGVTSVTLPHRGATKDVTYGVTQDPSRQGGWRVTVFEGGGAEARPVGHVEANDFAGAMRAAHEVGADLTRAEGWSLMSCYSPKELDRLRDGGHATELHGAAAAFRGLAEELAARVKHLRAQRDDLQGRNSDLVTRARGAEAELAEERQKATALQAGASFARWKGDTEEPRRPRRYLACEEALRVFTHEEHHAQKHGFVADCPRCRDFPISREEIGRCTSSSRHLADQLGGEVRGYAAEHNPGAKLGADEGGHDFVVVSNRYIVDWWAEAYQGQPALYDLMAPEDAARAKVNYGDREQWRVLQRSKAKNHQQEVRR